MSLWKTLWSDDFGIILSAEAVVVGTIAVVGLTAGMSVVATSVNEEMKDVAFAIRSLDQSYEIPPQEGCGARTAGSKFTQQPVEESLAELNQVYRHAAESEKAQADRLREQVDRQSESRKRGKKDRDKDHHEEDDDKADDDRTERRSPERNI